MRGARGVRGTRRERKRGILDIEGMIISMMLAVPTSSMLINNRGVVADT